MLSAVKGRHIGAAPSLHLLCTAGDLKTVSECSCYAL